MVIVFSFLRTPFNRELIISRDVRGGVVIAVLVPVVDAAVVEGKGESKSFFAVGDG